jgi:Tfp pilus assembly protein PilV
MSIKIKRNCQHNEQQRHSSQRGFTLIEAVCAMLILMVVFFGIAGVFIYSLRINNGNSGRTQALTIAQKEVERLRAARFSDAVLAGGDRNPVNQTGADNQNYRVQVSVDDDPSTTGVQTDATKTIKEITVRVTPSSVDGQWTQAAPVLIVTRRTKTF